MRVCLCVCLVYLIVFISIICVSQEEPSLITYNKQMFDFNKSIFLEKKINCERQIFDISELFIQSNKNSCCEQLTGGANIYL